MDRPDFLNDEQFQFLTQMNESDITNMFYAVPHILKHYPELTPVQAQQALLFRFVNSNEMSFAPVSATVM